MGLSPGPSGADPFPDFGRKESVVDAHHEGSLRAGEEALSPHRYVEDHHPIHKYGEIVVGSEPWGACFKPVNRALADSYLKYPRPVSLMEVHGFHIRESGRLVRA